MPAQSHQNRIQQACRAPGSAPCTQTKLSSEICAQRLDLLPCFQIQGSQAWSPILAMLQTEGMRLPHAKMFLPWQPRASGRGFETWVSLPRGRFPGTVAFFLPDLHPCSPCVPLTRSHPRPALNIATVAAAFTLPTKWRSPEAARPGPLSTSPWE